MRILRRINKKLEYVLGVDAGFWINLQDNYDRELADFEDINEIPVEELGFSRG